MSRLVFANMSGSEPKPTLNRRFQLANNPLVGELLATLLAGCHVSEMPILRQCAQFSMSDKAIYHYLRLNREFPACDEPPRIDRIGLQRCCAGL
jgi:hypothetical protein